jgi:predicted naringenin-chalcone synthase
MTSSVWISALGTAEPGSPISRQQTVAWMEPWLHPASDHPKLHLFAQRSGVDHRYSALDILGSAGDRIYPLGGLDGADLGERSALFDRLAPPLAEAAVRVACPHGPGRITHLITTTCTGAVAPGLEIRLCQRLGLDPTVRRLAITFMGCYAAIPGLRAAWNICRADPRARVLLVCCELSSLHFRPGPEDDALLAALLFGDGAAAVVVESSATPLGTGLRIVGDGSVLAPDSSDQMSWTAHADVFRLHLSSEITAGLAGVLPGLAARLLGPAVRPASVPWVVYPGGPRILDATEHALALRPGALDHSRRELARAGNRSSPTVLAILARHLHDPWCGLAVLLAFGPGLTADALVVERLVDPISLSAAAGSASA